MQNYGLKLTVYQLYRSIMKLFDFIIKMRKYACYVTII